MTAPLQTARIKGQRLPFCDRASAEQADMSEKRLELVRGLGAWASGAIVVGTMIGTGIFLKPAEMAREGRFVSVVFAAWIVGAILSLFGALSYAELGAMISFLLLTVLLSFSSAFSSSSCLLINFIISSSLK